MLVTGRSNGSSIGERSGKKEDKPKSSVCPTAVRDGRPRNPFARQIGCTRERTVQVSIERIGADCYYHMKKWVTATLREPPRGEWPSREALHVA